jgi:hypothetical protein
MRAFWFSIVLGVLIASCRMPEPASSSADGNRVAPTGAVNQTAPAPTGPGQQPEQDASPRHASFTLRNTCRETVKLFFGKTPKFGSGRTDSMSGNSRRNESMTEGEMIWIVDGSGNGISSYSVSAGVREVTISESCMGFQAR